MRSNLKFINPSLFFPLKEEVVKLSPGLRKGRGGVRFPLFFPPFLICRLVRFDEERLAIPIASNAHPTSAHLRGGTRPFAPRRTFSVVPHICGSDMSTLLLVSGRIEEPPIELYPVYVVLAGLALLAFVAVGMVASRKRRREHGQLWFPEGFKTSEPSKKKRREPVGEDSLGLRSVRHAVFGDLVA